MTTFIVKPGSDAFQLPDRLLNMQTEQHLDGPARRVLAVILKEAAARGAWPAGVDAVGPISLRLHAGDLRDGAGLSKGSYARLWTTLRQIEEARVLLSFNERHHRFPLIMDLTLLPGHYLELTLSGELSALHLRPLGRYALLNMGQIRQLRTPLDCVIYEFACFTSRMTYPQFKLHRKDLASATDAWVCWEALRRPLISSLARVARVVDARFFVEARCCGDSSGIDEVRVLPRHLTGSGSTPFGSPPKRGAIRMEISGTGVTRLS